MVLNARSFAPRRPRSSQLLTFAGGGSGFGVLAVEARDGGRGGHYRLRALQPPKAGHGVAAEAVLSFPPPPEKVRVLQSRAVPATSVGSRMKIGINELELRSGDSGVDI